VIPSILPRRVKSLGLGGWLSGYDNASSLGFYDFTPTQFVARSGLRANISKGRFSSESNLCSTGLFTVKLILALFFVRGYLEADREKAKHSDNM
jgi:hypothetical protein